MPLFLQEGCGHKPCVLELWVPGRVLPWQASLPDPSPGLPPASSNRAACCEGKMLVLGAGWDLIHPGHGEAAAGSSMQRDQRRCENHSGVKTK